DLAERISEIIFFCKHDSLVDQNKEWHYNQNINQRIRKNSYTEQHQNVSYIKWVAAMVEYPPSNQILCIHFSLFAATNYISETNCSASDCLSANGDSKPDNKRPEKKLFSKYLFTK